MTRWRRSGTACPRSTTDTRDKKRPMTKISPRSQKYADEFKTSPATALDDGVDSRLRPAGTTGPPARRKPVKQATPARAVAGPGPRQQRRTAAGIPASTAARGTNTAFNAAWRTATDHSVVLLTAPGPLLILGASTPDPAAKTIYAALDAARHAKALVSFTRAAEQPLAVAGVAFGDAADRPGADLGAVPLTVPAPLPASGGNTADLLGEIRHAAPNAAWAVKAPPAFAHAAEQPLAVAGVAVGGLDGDRHDAARRQPLGQGDIPEAIATPGCRRQRAAADVNKPPVALGTHAVADAADRPDADLGAARCGRALVSLARVAGRRLATASRTPTILDAAAIHPALFGFTRIRAPPGKGNWLLLYIFCNKGPQGTNHGKKSHHPFSAQYRCRTLESEGAGVHAPYVAGRPSSRHDDHSPTPPSEAKTMYIMGVVNRLAERRLVNYRTHAADEVRAMYEHIAAHPEEKPTLEEFIVALIMLGFPRDDGEEIITAWMMGLDTAPEDEVELARASIAEHRLCHGDDEMMCGLF